LFYIINISKQTHFRNKNNSESLTFIIRSKYYNTISITNKPFETNLNFNKNIKIKKYNFINNYENIYKATYLFIFFIISIQITYSYKIYTYENITDYVRNFNNKELKIYDKYIKVYEKNQSLSKSKVLKIKKDFFHSYYCRSNICVQVDTNSLPLIFIEIPDKDGNIKRYISKSYRYDEIESFRYSTIESGSDNNSFSTIVFLIHNV